MDLRDRHVVVTGAAGGIGSAIAKRLNDAGARLTVSDLHGADALARDLTNAVSVAADIGTESGNIDLIEAARSTHGEIDLFFANAGVAIGTDPMDAEGTWETAFAVNLHAHRWAARHLLPNWLERGEGYFCSTASAAGLLAQIGSAPYSVTKHGAVAFAEWLAITYGARGLRVSCLCPQGVNTNMLNSDVVGGGGGDVVRAVGNVLEAEEVAEVVHAAIIEERFLILPHPEVGDYLRHKGDDPARWISGMQRLQRRTLGL